jgi:hypothetical protein
LFGDDTVFVVFTVGETFGRSGGNTEEPFRLGTLRPGTEYTIEIQGTSAEWIACVFNVGENFQTTLQGVAGDELNNVSVSCSYLE